MPAGAHCEGLARPRRLYTHRGWSRPQWTIFIPRLLDRVGDNSVPERAEVDAVLIYLGRWRSPECASQIQKRNALGFRPLLPGRQSGRVDRLHPIRPTCGEYTTAKRAPALVVSRLASASSRST